MKGKNSLIQIAAEMHGGDDNGIKQKRGWIKTGAIQYARFKAAEQKTELALMLRSVKEDKEYVDLGYDTFTEYCERELAMSDSQCYEILKQLEALGDVPYENLLKIGISFRDLKSLREGKGSQQVEAAPEGDSITIAGEEVALIPENKPKIKALVKQLNDDLKAAKKDTKAELERRVEIEKKLQEAEKPKVLEVRNLEKFRLEADGLEKEFESILNRLVELNISANGVDQRVYITGVISKINANFGERFEHVFYE